MNSSPFALSRRRLAAILFGAGAFVVATYSITSAGSGTGRSSGYLHMNASSAVPAAQPTYTFVPVNDPTAGASNTQVTGIASFNDRTPCPEQIVGVYTGANGAYYSFTATPAPYKTTSGKCQTFTFPGAGFQPEPPGNPSDVYLSALNHHNNFQVGFAPPFASYCNIGTTSICGVIHDPGNSTDQLYQVYDSAEGHGNGCAQTYLYGTSDPRIQVGYYNYASGSGCSSQAFEEYGSPPQFFNFNLSSLKGTNTKAYGINNKGNVVGTMTVSGKTVGWEYTELRYVEVSIPGSNSTQAYGINWDDKVVGSCTGGPCNAKSSGFVSADPNTTQNNYAIINDGNAAMTVVNSIDDDSDIAGYTKVSGDLYGFVGTCNPCPASRGSTDITSPRRIRAAGQPPR